MTADYTHSAILELIASTKQFDVGNSANKFLGKTIGSRSRLCFVLFLWWIGGFDQPILGSNKLKSVVVEHSFFFAFGAL